MITIGRFRLLEAELRERGYGRLIEWSETIAAPANAEEFAERSIYVICNSGMRVTVAAEIYTRCIEALKEHGSVASALGHVGKASAIDRIWEERESYFAAFLGSSDQLAYLQTMPWIGPVTRHHLAKNLGADRAKPDVHLQRLARRNRTSVERLCARLARQTGYRVATIDTILWRACADGILDSTAYEAHGWQAAVKPWRWLLPPRKT
jgi:hypothetical protein